MHMAIGLGIPAGDVAVVVNGFGESVRRALGIERRVRSVICADKAVLHPVAGFVSTYDDPVGVYSGSICRNGPIGINGDKTSISLTQKSVIRAAIKIVSYDCTVAVDAKRQSLQ